MKYSLIFFLICALILNKSLTQNLGDGWYNEEENVDIEKVEEDKGMYKMVDELIDEYIEDREWEPEDTLDKEAFHRMFIYITQRGALKQGDTDILHKLADILLQKHGLPVKVKNIKNYFNLDELVEEFGKVFDPSKFDDEL